MRVTETSTPVAGQTVLVVGLGKSGQSACAFLGTLGCHVRATDSVRTPELTAAAERLAQAGVAIELGQHTESFCDGVDLVVVSPGVPETSLPVRWALQRGVPVIGELELGARFCRGRIVAISGSNGKSTTTALTGAILAMGDRPVVIAGNIGIPLTSQIGRIGPETTVVLEVSSFQLERVERFHPSVACLLNVTPNHLDRHHDFIDYVTAKRRLLTQQRFTDWAVLNADDAICQELRSSVRGRLLEFSAERPVRGAYVVDEALCVVLRARRHRVIPVRDLPLLGAHNVANVLAAIAIGGVMGLEPDTMAEAIRHFHGLPHRLESVAQWRGITFVNDSKSTTVDAGLRALEACPGRAVLIAGGKDKGSDFSRLREAVTRSVRAAVLLGVDAPRIAEAISSMVPTVRAQTMAEAVRTAARLAQPGDWVLLSPMCTSFDMFRDFEARGEAFTGDAHAFVALEDHVPTETTAVSASTTDVAAVPAVAEVG